MGLDPQQWNSGQISLFELFKAYVVIDIYGFFPSISSVFLDELTPHPSPPQVRSEPVATIVRAKVILHPIRLGIMLTYALDCLRDC